MYYPWLDAPFLTAPMLIAIVALLHVFVSHYAVGGGLLIARENSRALRKGDAPYREYWKKHAKFFILLTVPYGAITGVGIWFTIGIASPLATETLIRTFVFGWAIEWCFFLLEIVSGFALYYFWDKFGRKASSFVGWVYALSAWASLVLITGITSFMLNSSGLIEDWESTGNFWHAFLNAQFIPQTIARTGCALTLGTFYVIFHAAWREKNLDVREQVVKRMRFPAFFGLLLIAVGVVGWAIFLPESSRLTLERAAATNIFAGLFVAILVASAFLLIVGPCARPRETSVGQALAMLFMGFACVSVAEFVREAVRKPYVVDRVVYSHQVARADVPNLRQTGLLYNGVWTRKFLDDMQEKYPELTISAERYLGWAPTTIEKPEWAKRADAQPAPPSVDEPKPDAEDGNLEPKPDSETATPAQDEGASLGADYRRAFVATTVAQQTTLGGSRFAPAATPRPAVPEASQLSAPLPASNALAPQALAAPTQTLAPTQTTAPTQPLAPTQNLAHPQTTAPTQTIAPGNARGGERLQTLGSANSAPTTMLPASADAVGAPQASSSVAQPPRGATPMRAQDLEPGLNAAFDAEDESASDDPIASDEEAEDVVEKTPAELDLEVNGPIARGNEDLLKVDEEDRLALGRAVFLHHCNACHAADHGYSALGPMIAGKSSQELASFALRLNHSHFYMPPWSGVEVEAELLGEYLASIGAKTPKNVFMKELPKKIVENVEESAPEENAPATGEEETPLDATPI